MFFWMEYNEHLDNAVDLHSGKWRPAAKQKFCYRIFPNSYFMWKDMLVMTAHSKWFVTLLVALLTDPS